MEFSHSKLFNNSGKICLIYQKLSKKYVFNNYAKYQLTLNQFALFVNFFIKEPKKKNLNLYQMQSEIKKEAVPDEIQKENKENSQQSNSIPKTNKKRKVLVQPKLDFKKLKCKTSQENSEDSQPEQQQPVLKPENNYHITKFFKQERIVHSKGKNSVQQDKQQILKIQQQQANLAQIPDLSALCQKLTEKEAQEKQLSQELEFLRKTSNQMHEKQTQYKKKVQEMFKQQLKENENLKRQQLKEQLEKEKYRWGEFIQKREGVRFTEEWVDGFDIRQVKEKLKQLEIEQENLEKQKKELKSKSQNNKSVKSKVPEIFDQNHTNDLDLKGKKQRINFQIFTVQKEQNSLKATLQRYEEEKAVLIQKLRRFNEEINCRYAQSESGQSSWPCLTNKYQLLSLLGKGGFSEVYKAFDLEEFRLVACKIHQLNPNWSEQSKANYIKHALRESSIQQKLKHQNIVSFYDMIEIDNDSFCTVLEYCDGLDLSQYLKKYKILTEKEAKIIIRQVLSALYYLNGQYKKIIHYDLKPQNILFNKGELKITDFGLSKIIDNEQTKIELTSQVETIYQVIILKGLGTYWYLPPECFLSDESNISTKVDVWSVGVIMFEMVYGQRPFGQGMSQERIIKEQIILKSTSVNFPQKPNVSSECKDFIKKCLTYNMEARWDITDAYCCPYINSK